MRESNSGRVAILGSGLVAHAASLLIDSCVIFTKRKTDVFLDNIFFHDTPENRMLLLICGAKIKSVDIPVYYYNCSNGELTSVLTQKIAETIAIEKMGSLYKGQDAIISNINFQDQKFRNLIFDEYELTKNLMKSHYTLDIYPTRIIENEEGVALYFGNDVYHVDYVINTIPQIYFSKLLSDKDVTDLYKYRSLTMLSKKVDYPDSMTYSYNSCVWKRQFVKNNIMCTEYDTEEYEALDDDRKFELDLEYETKTVIPYGRILSNPVQDTKRIFHVGRFAQWDHRITTEHCIQKLLKIEI